MEVTIESEVIITGQAEPLTQEQLEKIDKKHKELKDDFKRYIEDVLNEGDDPSDAFDRARVP